MSLTRLEAYGIRSGPLYLFNLPVDIQKKIYAYALITNNVIDLAKKSFLTYSALLYVCTKTRKDAIPIFFSKNVFIVSGMGSYGANYVKHADGHLTKIWIDFSVPPELHKKYPHSTDPNSKDAMALFEEVRDYPESLVGLLLTFEVSVSAIELVRPEIKDEKPTTDQLIHVLLNSLLDVCLKNQSQPEKQAARRLMKQRVDDIINKDSKLTGKDAKLALKDLDVGRKVAAKLNGGKGYGVGGLGVESDNFSDYLKAEDAVKAATGSKDVEGKRNKKEGVDTAAGTKKRARKKKPKKGRDGGEDGAEVRP